MLGTLRGLNSLITRLSRGTVCALVVLTLGGPASAQTTLYSTGFENPPFADGSLLAGQDGWVTPATLSPNAGIISTGAAHTGLQGLRVPGSLMDSTFPSNSVESAGSYRRPVNFNTLTNNASVIRLEADVRLDGPQTPVHTDHFSANIAARSDIGSLGELTISSDGMIYAYDGIPNSPDDDNPQIRAATTLNEWHRLVIETNFATDTTSFFVDAMYLGQLVGSPNYATDLYLRGAIVTTARPETAQYKRGDYTAYFDNFRIITVVPEPGSTALLVGFGVTGLRVLLRRWRGDRLSRRSQG